MADEGNHWETWALRARYPATKYAQLEKIRFSSLHNVAPTLPAVPKVLKFAIIATAPEVPWDTEAPKVSEVPRHRRYLRYRRYLREAAFPRLPGRRGFPRSGECFCSGPEPNPHAPCVDHTHGRPVVYTRPAPSREATDGTPFPSPQIIEDRVTVPTTPARGGRGSLATRGPLRAPRCPGAGCPGRAWRRAPPRRAPRGPPRGRTASPRA